MEWIYDQQTEHSRLAVAYDRWGITIREWSDELPEDEDTGYTYQGAFFTWESYRNRERCYSMDDGSGRIKKRIVNGAISLLAYYGGSSDESGIVPDLHTVSDCGYLSRF